MFEWRKTLLEDAYLSIFGVLIEVFPKHPRSPIPRSSAINTTILGFSEWMRGKMTTTNDRNTNIFLLVFCIFSPDNADRFVFFKNNNKTGWSSCASLWERFRDYINSNVPLNKNLYFFEIGRIMNMMRKCKDFFICKNQSFFNVDFLLKNKDFILHFVLKLC